MRLKKDAWAQVIGAQDKTQDKRAGQLTLAD